MGIFKVGKKINKFSYQIKWKTYHPDVKTCWESRDKPLKVNDTCRLWIIDKMNIIIFSVKNIICLGGQDGVLRGTRGHGEGSRPHPCSLRWILNNHIF